MNPLTLIDSTIAVFPVADVDTDQIIPARFLTTTTRDGLGEKLFHDLRYLPDGSRNPGFFLNQPGADGCRVLVAERNFGCGSSREHAAWALADYGFQAVISSEIADIFRSNALKNGVLPVIVEDELLKWLLERPGSNVKIDVAASTLTVEDGRSFSYPIDGFARYCLLEGIDQLGFLQKHMDEIERFEAGRAWQP